MIKISIIVPVYNVERYLKECLDSLLSQDLPLSEYEIILVNDGSKDRSGDIAKGYCSKYDNISYYEQKNQGQAVARNLGIEKALGEYLLFVDSDDKIECNSLKLLYDIAQEYSNDILITGYHVYSKDGSHTNYTDFCCFDKNYFGRDALLNGLNIASVCARLYSRQFILKHNLRFMLGIKHEDVYFNVLAYSSANSIRSLNIYTYFYRWNEGSTDRSFDRKSITKGIFSDLEVAFIENEMSSKYKKTDKKLSDYFKKQSNSLLVSNILTLSKRKMITERTEYIRKAKGYSLYPICGGTNSWKSFLLGKLFNIFIR